MVAKCGFARCAPQRPGVGVSKHGAGVVMIHQWELSKLGGDVLGAPGQRVSTRQEQVSHCPPVYVWPGRWGRELPARAQSMLRTCRLDF